MFDKLTPLQREWAKLEKQEAAYLMKQMEKSDSKLNQALEKKVPPTLQNTLNTAFSRAFYMVFEKGTAIIEKTYKRDELLKNYQINDYAAQVRGDRKSLKAFSKKASGSGNVNLLLSGVSGVGLGFLGIGIPDIVLFTGIVLKSVYEIALDYGFDYQSDAERRFILLLIQGALCPGEELRVIDQEVNYYIQSGNHFQNKSMDTAIVETSAGMSRELLYMKFLQGIPIVGAVGGVYDAIYLKKIVKYAELKYRRRFLHGRGDY